MNFIENIFELFYNLGEHLSNLFNGFIEFLTAPFALLLTFFEGIFYFIISIFAIVVMIVQIFVALFQFFFAIVSAVMTTINNMVGFSPSGYVHMDSPTQTGFNAVLEQINGTGLLTTVPNVLIAVTWFFFALKVIGLLGENKGAPKPS